MERAWVLSAVRQKLAEQGVDAIALHTADHRRYVSGFTGSSGVAVIAAAGRPVLLTDFRYLEQAAAEAPEWEVVRHGQRVWEDVARLAGARGWGSRVAVEAARVSLADWREITAVTGVEWVAVAGVMEAIRVIKRPPEVEAIAQACAIADAAFRQVLPLLRPGVREVDVAWELEFAMRRAGAERPAFDTIVASGPRGSLPHARPGERRLAAGELVTVDFGAVWQGYCSDETVTVALGTPTDPELARIFQVVAAAQQAGLAAVRAGTAASAVDAAARQVIAEAGYGEFFGHSTGHGVGIEVHELPWVAPNPPQDYALQAGMVVTVEPGIYLPGRGGVRLEDTVLVTDSGYRRLTGIDKRQWIIGT